MNDEDGDQIMHFYSDGYDSDSPFLDDDNSDADFSYRTFQQKHDHDELTYHHSYYACHRIKYKVLCESDIRQRMKDAVRNLSTFLSLPRHEASLLLIHFNWSVNEVIGCWILNESLVREKVGLFDKSVKVVRSDKSDEFKCGICFESYPHQELVSALCGHLYCRACWCGYISTSINDNGVGCLKLRCPENFCHAAVTLDMMISLVSEDDKKKLAEFLVRSYIEENRKTKWCTNPGCDYAIKFEGGNGMSFDVTCRCLNSFCWNCNEERHRPLDCKTMKTWIEFQKNYSDSKNENYIHNFCKPCPNCRRPIEKEGGCMHMRCSMCKYDFNWQTQYKWGIQRKEMDLQFLVKYTHYFKLWDANRIFKLKALSDFKRVKSVQFERLSKLQGVEPEHFDFISEAWLQIVECRRVLEWSYAYAYFMPEHEILKKEFLEFSQGVAESKLEKLHKLAQMGLERSLADTTLSEDFKEFRTELVGLTVVTANYFESLLRALENGLSDIASSNDQDSSGNDNSFKNEKVDL